MADGRMSKLSKLLLTIGSSVAEEIIIGPTYTIDPAVTDQGQPKGRRFELSMKLVNSTSLFNGTGPCVSSTNPSWKPSQWRQVLVQIPHTYKDGDEAPLLVLQDGGTTSSTSAQLLDFVANVQSNLHAGADAHRTLPAFITLAIANGGGGGERAHEYCTMSDAYARFVEDEVLPTVLRNRSIRSVYPKLRFTSDPWGRGAMGCSDGGAAALTMGYFRPDLYRRVAAYSPSVVNLQCEQAPEARTYPKGGWEYHSHMKLLQTHAKPLRVFVANSQFDLCVHSP